MACCGIVGCIVSPSLDPLRICRIEMCACTANDRAGHGSWRLHERTRRGEESSLRNEEFIEPSLRRKRSNGSEVYTVNNCAARLHQPDLFRICDEFVSVGCSAGQIHLSRSEDDSRGQAHETEHEALLPEAIRQLPRGEVHQA